MWLADIRDACDVIALATGDLDVAGYAADVVVRSAVERQFEIIGEAMKRAIAAEPSLELRLPEAREVIAFRNFLAHGYHLVEHDRVWQIVRQDVPALHRRVVGLLSE